MLYKLTNFRFIVIKPFYINPALDIILTYNLINPARVINKTKELAITIRAIKLVVEIPFY
jgi:hypothetical protein